MGIARLMYVSKSRQALTSDQMDELLETARYNNARNGITGLLLYTADSFIQVLEGPEEAVGKTFDAIRKDPRHRDITVLIRDRIEARSFPGWAMGYETRPSAATPTAQGWFSLSESALDIAMPASVAPEVRLLLTSFFAIEGDTVAA